MDRLVQSVLGGSSCAWIPAADVTEDDDADVVEIELPGVNRRRAQWQRTGGDRELKGRERKGLLRRRTRRVGSGSPSIASRCRASFGRTAARLRCPVEC